MDSTIIAAIIGAAATVGAALIGVSFLRKSKNSSNQIGQENNSDKDDQTYIDKPIDLIPISDELSHDHGKIIEKIPKLVAELEAYNFIPSLIIAVSRGGLFAAAGLAKRIDEKADIPVISLWPKPTYNNCLNRIKIDQKELGWDKLDKVKILIVDDICRRGTTLVDAKGYVENLFHGVHPEIRTAAVTYYTGIYARPTPPDFKGETTPMRRIRDASGRTD
jgi:hypoxanthine phosphoribosyltransferase